MRVMNNVRELEIFRRKLQELEYNQGEVAREA